MNKRILLTTAGALILGATILAPLTSAYQGNPSVKGPAYSPERHEAMTKAFANKNYEEWKALMGERNGRVTQVVTKENFAKFAQAHQLMMEGKVEEAKAIRAELGLGKKDGSGQGQGVGKQGKRGGMGGNCPYMQ
jgi:hypothetical protein